MKAQVTSVNLAKKEGFNLNDDFNLTVINQFECQFNSEGIVEKYSLQGSILAQNASKNKFLGELLVLVTIPEKNITTEITFTGLNPGIIQKKELMTIKLNSRDIPPPVLLTEIVSSIKGGKGDFRVLYPFRNNEVDFSLIVTNHGDIIVQNIRVTKKVDSSKNLQKEQIRVDAGNVTLEGNTLIWDIKNIEPKQSVTLTFSTMIVLESLEPPINSPVTLIYEIPAKNEKKSMWTIQKCEILDPLDIEQRAFKRLPQQGLVTEWDCQVALKNNCDLTILIHKIKVTAGNRKDPVFERSPQRGNTAIELTPHKAWQSDIWMFQQDAKPTFNIILDTEFIPRVYEQVQYNLTTCETPFEIAKIRGNRTIHALDVYDAHKIQVLLESALTNLGSAPLTDVEIIHVFPHVVKLPEPSAVLLFLRGPQNLRCRIEFNLSTDPSLPDCNIFRIVIKDLVKACGGLKRGETLHAIFPIILPGKPEHKGVLSFPTFFNALVHPNTPLLEDQVNDYSITRYDVKPKHYSGDTSSPIPEKSFAETLLLRFSDLAVEAYNAHEYEDAIAYCERMVCIAQRLENESLVKKFEKILSKLQAMGSR